MPPPSRARVVGHDLELDVDWDYARNCHPWPSQIPLPVRVEVTDPEGQLLEASLAEPWFENREGRYSSDGRRLESVIHVRVRFHAGKYGPHLVKTWFGDLAFFERFVWAVDDRRGRAPDFVERTPGTQCVRVDRTRAGGLLCRESNQTTTFFRQGVARGSWPEAEAHVLGDVVWMIGKQGFARLADDGDGPLRQTAWHPAPGLWRSGIETFAADADHLVASEVPDFGYFGVTDGGLERISTLSVGDYAAGVAVSFSADAGTAIVLKVDLSKGLEFPWRWARLPLVASDPVPEPQWSEAGRWVEAQTEDGLWLGSSPAAAQLIPGQYSIDFIPFDPREPRATMLVPTGAPLLGFGLNAGGTDELESSACLVVDFDRGEPRYGWFETDADAGFTLRNATGDFLHAQRGEEHAFYRLRPAR